MRSLTLAFAIVSTVLLVATTAPVAVVEASQCPSGQLATMKPKFTFTTNGCGAGGMMIQTDDDFTPCCDKHDACYSVCGISKALCEDKFKKCLNKHCETKSKNPESCSGSANMFAMGATALGGNAFEEAQKDSCYCVPEAAFGKGFVDAAKKLYTKQFEMKGGDTKNGQNDMEVEDKVAKYRASQMSKHTGNGKEAKLLLSLLEKYPELIEPEGEKEPKKGGSSKKKKVKGAGSYGDL